MTSTDAFPDEIRCLRQRAAYDPAAREELAIVTDHFFAGAAMLRHAGVWLLGLVCALVPYTVVMAKMLGALSVVAWG